MWSPEHTVYRCLFRVLPMGSNQKAGILRQYAIRKHIQVIYTLYVEIVETILRFWCKNNSKTQTKNRHLHDHCKVRFIIIISRETSIYLCQLWYPESRRVHATHTTSKMARMQFHCLT